jgi:hypothetical protein
MNEGESGAVRVENGLTGEMGVAKPEPLKGGRAKNRAH